MSEKDLERDTPAGAEGSSPAGDKPAPARRRKKQDPYTPMFEGVSEEGGRKIRPGKSAKQDSWVAEQIAAEAAGQGHSRPRRRWVKWVAIAAAVVLLLGGGAFAAAATGLFYDSIPYMRFGGVTVSVAEYNLVYNNTIISFVTQYNTYLEQLGLDIEKPLTSQPSYEDPDKTWAELFHGNTIDALTYGSTLYAEALARGIALSDEERARIDTSIEGLRDTAEASSMSLSSYLAKYYGKGVTENTVRRYIEKNFYVNAMHQALDSEIAVTAADVDAEYAANADAYQLANLRNAYVAAEVNESGVLGEGAMDAAKARAEEFLSRISGEASFNELAAEYSDEMYKSYYEEDPDASLVSNLAKSGITEAPVSDWIFSADRKPGDTGIVASEGGYYVFYFIGLARNTDRPVTFRHVLIAFSEDMATDPTEEQRAAAKAKIDEIEAAFKANGATEDAIAALATAESDDTGSSADGGKITSNLGELVAPMESWLFDAARKSGDYAVIESTYGYHLTYWVERGAEGWYTEAEEALKTRLFEDAITALEAIHPMRESGVGKMLIDRNVALKKFFPETAASSAAASSDAASSGGTASDGSESAAG